MTDKLLSEYDMTLDQWRAMVTRHAYRSQERFGTYVNRLRDLTDADAEAMHIANHACLYGWATVSLIGFIRDRLGEDAAFEAAEMVGDMAANGDAPFTDDLPYPPIEGKTR